MIADIDIIHGNYNKQVATQVGHLLSTNKAGTNPSVIKDIQGGNRPDFPFISVTIKEDGNESGGHVLDQYTIPDGNGAFDKHIFSEQKLLLTIKCCGDDATQILKELRMNVLDDSIRVDMNTAVGAKFQYYSPSIDRSPIYLNTEFVNAASMDVCFIALSDWTRTTNAVIETVEGEVRYLDYPTDDNPLIRPLNLDSTT
jgi:hypothetical protein